MNTGIKDIFEKQCVVFGCGNTLMGDDGFGPAVMEYLQAECSLPDYITCIDVGTSIRDILFDIMLSEKRPRQIIIIDAADNPGKDTGELYEIDIDGIAPAKANDFSLHQFPTKNISEVTITDKPIGAAMVVGGAIALLNTTFPIISFFYNGHEADLVGPDFPQRIKDSDK